MNIGRAPKPIGKWVIVAALSLAGWGLIAFLFYALADEYWYAAFGSDEYSLSVAGSTTSFEQDAMIEIDDPDHTANVLLDSEKIDQVLKMFESAKAGQSSGWHEVGSLREDMPSWWGPSLLTVSAGPGVRFVIHDHGACLSYDLTPEDFKAFERAAQRARRHFDSEDADRGLASSFDPKEDAFQRGKKSSGPIPQAFPGCR